MSKGDNKQVDAITSKQLDDLFEDKPKPKPKPIGSGYYGGGRSQTSSYWDYGNNNRDMFGRQVSLPDSDYDNKPYDWNEWDNRNTAKLTSTLETTLRDDIEDSSRNGRLEISGELFEDMIQHASDELSHAFSCLDIYLDGSNCESYLRDYLKRALLAGDLEKGGIAAGSIQIIFTGKEKS